MIPQRKNRTVPIGIRSVIIPLGYLSCPLCPDCPTVLQNTGCFAPFATGSSTNGGPFLPVELGRVRFDDWVQI
jgi:hypothetical protein